MPGLVPPAAGCEASFREAWREFVGAGEDPARGLGAAGFDLAGLAGDLRPLLGHLGALADAEGARPPGRVPATVLWWVAGGTWIGHVTIRHFLTYALLNRYGQVGVSVRPSLRRQGHGRAALRAALPHAAALGIDPLLATCHQDNEPSRRLIEGCGGEEIDPRHGYRRYWIPTQAS